MDFVPFPELHAAGIRQEHRRESAPDPITSEWLAEQIATSERVLRLQYEEGEFPPEWEAELATMAGDDITSLLQRWAYLKHLRRVRWERLSASPEPSDADSQEAARQILRREPVTVWLGRHRVGVTSRSYSAMAEIAVHDLTCRQLNEDVKLIMSLAALCETQLKQVPLWARGPRNRLRHRLRVLVNVLQRTYSERELHRMHIYAHALTPHGGPAVDVAAEAPSWWREMSAEDDAVLLLALFQAGPLRYQKLGHAPPSRSRSRTTFREDLGFFSLFASWEKELGLAPAELADRDLAQVLTHIRASAIALPEPAASPSEN